MRRAGFLALSLLLAALLSAAPALSRPDAAEMALGDKIYNEMQSSGYLLPNSPEAKLLAPVAKQLKATGDRLYGAPFTFYVQTSMTPNAFYVYGPRVYVNRGLIRLADSREELAGVLCHEMSHALHKDGSNDDARSQEYDTRVKLIVLKMESATHGRLSGTIGKLSKYGENFLWLKHSRGQEERADLAGADLCARANFNPWGMVWMFQKMERDIGSHGLAWFSDHPDMKKRIALLKKHFRENPAVFARFSSNEITATPLWLGASNASTTFGAPTDSAKSVSFLGRGFVRRETSRAAPSLRWECAEVRRATRRPR